MPIPADRRRSHLAREVGTMALSCVRVDNPMALVRAAAWSNAIARLGTRMAVDQLTKAQVAERATGVAQAFAAADRQVR